MLKDLKKVNGLAICSFLFAVLSSVLSYFSFFSTNNSVDLIEIFIPITLPILAAILSVIALLFGYIVLAGSSHGYDTAEKFNESRKAEIILSKLGIFIVVGEYAVLFIHILSIRL